MAKVLHAESRRMYSWWWDSHLCPKNSKWLQENLTDMDVKVKSMIKLIEEDADSFARKAEMYYQKRPELMKLVEEFYRAYRALAERYDHATRVIQHAHNSMSEALPNQVPLIFADNLPPSAETDTRPPEMFNRSRNFTDDLNSVAKRKAVKLLDDPLGLVESVGRGLNFGEGEEKQQGVCNNDYINIKAKKWSISDHEAEEILVLKQALTKPGSEKEADVVQHQGCLDKLSDLLREVAKAKEDFRGLMGHESKAENQVVVLEESITRLEGEKESKLQDYKQGVNWLWNLETGLSTAQENALTHDEWVNNDEIEVNLKIEPGKSAVEKSDALSKYMQSLETISNLENKLQHAKEDARRLKERAEKAESEVEIHSGSILKLTEEKEAAATQYQQCLKTLSSLENKLTCAQNEVTSLNVEIDNGVSKFRSVEEKCLLLETLNRSLRSEMESLLLKMGTQTQELTKKQKELGRLYAEMEGRCITLGKEKESALCKVEELQASLKVQKQQHASYVKMTENRLRDRETEMRVLQEECEWRKRELDQVLDNAIDGEIQIFVLQRTAQHMKESNFSLSIENHKLSEKSRSSANNISQLERKISNQQVEIKSLLDQTANLRAGACQLVRALNIVEDCAYGDKAEQDQIYINQMLNIILNMKSSIFEAVEENLEQTVELSVLVMWTRQLRLGLQNLEVERGKIGRDLNARTEQVLSLQNEAITLLQTNKELREADCSEEALETQIENLCLKECLHELHDELNKRKIEEEILQVELQKKLTEIDEMETEAASVSGQLHYSTVSQLLYEQKALELCEACLCYMDQNKHLKIQFSACSPQIKSLKECISSLENHLDVHIKFQDPENNELQSPRATNNPPEVIVHDDMKAFMPSILSNLCNVRVRLQATVKAAIEIKEQLVQENIDLRSKLHASTRQLELLQSGSVQHRTSIRLTSEITEADSVLLTKDIVLDRISDSSSKCFRKREPVVVNNQTLELWDTGDPDGNIGLTFSKCKQIFSPSSSGNTGSCRVKSMKKQKAGDSTSDSLFEVELSVGKLGISKRISDPIQEVSERKFLQRLNSDVRNLESLRITVQDLKRKLEITSKNKRGKIAIECEVLKGQLEEADIAIVKLFDLKDRLMKSINNRSFSSTNSSFGSEEVGSGRRRKLSRQAQKMAEKIGRLDAEVQKLQFSLQKLDNENEGRLRAREPRRRVLLKDYLYGGGRSTSHRPRKAPICGCMWPSTNQVCGSNAHLCFQKLK